MNSSSMQVFFFYYLAMFRESYSGILNGTRVQDSIFYKSSFTLKLDFEKIEFQNRDILLNSKKNKDKSPFSLKLVNQLWLIYIYIYIDKLSLLFFKTKLLFLKQYQQPKSKINKEWNSISITSLFKFARLIMNVGIKGPRMYVGPWALSEDA